MSRQFLVYGAAGAQGGAVARTLLERGNRVRLLLRSAATNPFPGNPRVEVVVGELGDRDALRRASHGVDGVSLVMPLVYDRPRVVQWGRNAIDAAAEARVPVLVFNTSSVVPAARVGVTALDIKVELEDCLARSPLPSIVIRPTIYSDNLIAPWSAPAIVHDGVLPYPIPAEQPVSWICLQDVADHVAAALDRPGLAASKPVFAIGGGAALTGNDIARAIGSAVGREVSYVAVPLDQFESGLTQTLGPEAAREVVRFYDWLTRAARGNPLEIDGTPARASLAVEARPFAEWAQSVPWRLLAGAPVR